ncbi:MAG: hypothetical protein AAF202_12680, partial [Pseudomonadota bacterium]
MRSHRNAMAISRTAGTSAEFKKTQKAFLGGMTWYGLSLGAIASFAWGMGGQYLKACSRLFSNGRPIDENPALSPAEKIQYEQMCDDGFRAFISNNWGQFARQTAALFPTIGIMAFAQSRLLSGMTANNTTIRDAWGRYKKGWPNGKPTFRGLWGLARGVGRIALVVGTTFVAGMIAFTVLHFTIEQIIEWFYYRWTVVRPLTNSREDFKDAIAQLRADNWRLMDYTGLEGEELTNKHLEAHMGMLEKMSAYSEASDEIRNHEIKKVQNALENWSNKYAKSVNIYAAAKLFYSDVAEQIRLRRAQSKPLTFLAPTDRGYNFQNIINHSDEDLPMFRSSPFHGLDASLLFTFRNTLADQAEAQADAEAASEGDDEAQEIS